MAEGQNLKLERRSLAKESQESRRQRQQRRRTRESKEERQPPLYQQLRGLREPQSADGIVTDQFVELGSAVRSTTTKPPADGTWIVDGVMISWLLAKVDTATMNSNDGTRQT